MRTFLIVLTFLILFLGMEFVYLSFSMSFYKRKYARIQNIDVKDIKPYKFWPMGFIAYFVISLAIWFLVIYQTKAIIEICVKATILALAIYGTFNFTNYVIFEGYDLGLVIRDTLWGIFVVNVASVLTFLVSIWL